MCGIAGYIGKFPPKPENLHKTSTVMEHRGPDGNGFFFHNSNNQYVALIHRRLAIIDLNSRSSQPFHYNDSVLVYNGEIYNYLEVRSSLEELGHVFKTKGDTEVLIHALFEWGKDALDKLEGMWSFAWYNKKNGNLIISRDRFGEKPLFFWDRKDGIYFASEVKALAALAGEWPKINQKQILRNLSNGYRSLNKTKETYFEGVKVLPPATYAQIDYKGLNSIISYWQPNLTENNHLSSNEVISMTKDALINAVKLRMRSDVPIAFCMSGGVDSNSLISIASKELNCNVHGFTIVNTDKRYKEQKLVDQAVRELSINHTQVTLSKKNFLSNMRKLVLSHDAPVSTISYYVHWILMKQIYDEGFKISISGTGADEIFSGYYDHHLFYLSSVFTDTNQYKLSKNNWRKNISPLVRNDFLKNPDRFIKYPKFRDHIYSGNDFEKYLKISFNEKFTEKEFPTSLLRKRMLNELFEEVVPIILHEDDLNSMHYSIENRSPFLDRNLFETTLKFPTKYLVQDGKAKFILRESMRNIVPNAILDTYNKVGFNAPVEDLVDFNNNHTREQILDNNPIFYLIKREMLEKLMSKKSFSNEESKFLFSFLSIKFFLEKFSN